MERETIKITTPVDKHEVILNAWITGKERRDIQRPFMTTMSVTVKGGEPEVEAKDASAVLEQVENRTIELTVVSVNGKTEKVLEQVLDMKSNDFTFVLKEINKITKETDFTKPE